MQSAHRIVNITIAKVYRTIFYEAPCLMAGVPLIGIAIDGNVRLYKRKVGLERIEHPCDTPLPVNEWLHTAPFCGNKRTDNLSYIENYADGSKDAGKGRAGVAIYSKKQLPSKCK